MVAANFTSKMTDSKLDTVSLESAAGRTYSVPFERPPVYSSWKSSKTFSVAKLIAITVIFVAALLAGAIVLAAYIQSRSHPSIHTQAVHEPLTSTNVDSSESSDEDLNHSQDLESPISHHNEESEEDENEIEDSDDLDGIIKVIMDRNRGLGLDCFIERLDEHTEPIRGRKNYKNRKITKIGDKTAVICHSLDFPRPVPFPFPPPPPPMFHGGLVPVPPGVPVMLPPGSVPGFIPHHPVPFHHRMPFMVPEHSNGPVFGPGHVPQPFHGPVFVPAHVPEQRNGPVFAPEQHGGPMFVPVHVAEHRNGPRFVPEHVPEHRNGPMLIPEHATVPQRPQLVFSRPVPQDIPVQVPQVNNLHAEVRSPYPLTGQGNLPVAHEENPHRNFNPTDSFPDAFPHQLPQHHEQDQELHGIPPQPN